MEGDGQGGESPGPLPAKAQFPSPRPQLVLKSMLENVTFWSFFFLEQSLCPVAVSGPSDCPLLVTVYLWGPGARGHYCFFPSSPGSREGGFRLQILFLPSYSPASLGPVEARGGGPLPAS